MRKPFALIPATLLLASCGAADTEQQTVPPPPVETAGPLTLGEHDTFKFNTEDGAEGTLTLPSAPYALMEDLYAAEGVTGDRTYATIDVDNRYGSEDYGVLEVNLYTPEGDVHTLESVNTASHDLSPFDTDAAWEASEALDEETWEDVAVGERRNEYVVTSEPLPAEVTRVEVVQSGGPGVEAHPFQ